ncbi:hypothetical protein FB45DRAFT_138959 [Roridomyces roridus]|uniref:FAD-binding domain-containing protein n=1 Tax=Roridomyces roridus TaxID=1738132 RepID=A0AAD7FFP4_9AGAR|nr:hypothetical protein FB45DRAFT_138959 [Roridomyces roridus]
MVPPNACKILNDWGLDAELHANSSPAAGVGLHRYDQDKFLGLNCWDPEILAEARGGYWQLTHRDLIRMLYELAIKPSEDDSSSLVSVMFGAEVVKIDCETPSVTLRSGEVHTADGILGADGARGVVRRTLMEEEGVSSECEDFSGLWVYSALIPKTLVLENDLGWLREFPFYHTWSAPNRAAKTLAVGKDGDISLVLYTPDGSENSAWTEEAEIKLPDVLGPCLDWTRKLAGLAGPAAGIPIKRYYELESWTSESGRVLAIGDAAHPSTPGSMHSYSISLEDGVFVGKLFSHTRNTERVPEFFRAFQEHRETRCTRIQKGEEEVVRLLTVPEGPEREASEANMCAKQALGSQNVLDGDLANVLDDLRMVFSYDARDDADEYWMSWGRYGSTSESTSIMPLRVERTYEGTGDSNGGINI